MECRCIFRTCILEHAQHQRVHFSPFPRSLNKKHLIRSMPSISLILCPCILSSVRRLLPPTHLHPLFLLLPLLPLPNFVSFFSTVFFSFLCFFGLLCFFSLLYLLYFMFLLFPYSIFLISNFSFLVIPWST